MAESPTTSTEHAKPAGYVMIEELGLRRDLLVRKTLMYTPLAVVFGGVAAAALYYAFTSSLGALVGASIFGLPAFAFAYEAATAVRDLRAEPVVTRGTIARMWNKGTVLWMSRAYYLLVESPSTSGNPKKELEQHFFVISPVAYLQLEDGRTVVVEHWPHTNTVISLGMIESTRAPRGTRG
jgi:hypothetical protein